MATTQLNLRLPVDIKTKAQNKAESFWTNLNFLVKLFLIKFVQDDNLVEIKQNIKMDKIFDKWLLEYLKSWKAKETNTQINKHLEKNNRWRI